MLGSHLQSTAMHRPFLLAALTMLVFSLAHGLSAGDETTFPGADWEIAWPWAQPESEIDGRGVYGFNWWANGVQPNSERKWPEAPHGAYAASGHNNNKMFVIPEWRLVVVRLGLDEDQGKTPDAVWSRFLGMIGEAIKP
jgi:hypothetical protein